MELIQQHQQDINAVCTTYNVEELYAFGSILTNHFNVQSDVDLIVTIRSDDPLEYAENYFDLKFELERIFQRKVDLLEQKAIRNKTFEHMINQNKVLVYASRN